MFGLPAITDPTSRTLRTASRSDSNLSQQLRAETLGFCASPAGSRSYSIPFRLSQPTSPVISSALEARCMPPPSRARHLVQMF